MKSTRVSSTAPRKEIHIESQPLFYRENRIWMIAGAVVLLIGFILMAGGRSEDPNIFNKEEVYSARRITVAPIVLLIGLVIEVFAIFRKPKRG